MEKRLVQAGISATPHRWRFFRSSGSDQVRLERGSDLLALDQLDQKLWAALSCPIHGLEFDSKTLALIASDGDGHIRVLDVLAAVKRAGAVLKNPDDLIQGTSSLPLAAISDTTAEGAQFLTKADAFTNGDSDNMYVWGCLATEFEGITDQVLQDLCQLCGIARDRRAGSGGRGAAP